MKTDEEIYVRTIYMGRERGKTVLRIHYSDYLWEERKYSDKTEALIVMMEFLNVPMRHKTIELHINHK